MSRSSSIRRRLRSPGPERKASLIDGVNLNQQVTVRLGSAAAGFPELQRLAGESRRHRVHVRQVRAGFTPEPVSPIELRIGRGASGLLERSQLSGLVLRGGEVERD